MMRDTKSASDAALLRRLLRPGAPFLMGRCDQHLAE